MKLIAERRKSHFIFAFAMAIIFLSGLIFLLKYYDLQRRYFSLLRKQARSMPVQAIAPGR